VEDNTNLKVHILPSGFFPGMANDKLRPIERMELVRWWLRAASPPARGSGGAL